MDIGKMKVSEVYPYLQLIANEFGLRLNRYSEFNLAKKILVNRYMSN